MLVSRASVCFHIPVVGYLLKSSHAEDSGTADRHKHRLGEARRRMLAPRSQEGSTATWQICARNM